MSATDVQIFEELTIPLSDLSFETARSSGPGGQHVNKTETKVTLLFDVDGTDSLSEEQKAVVREHLATRISKEGVLRVSSQRHRSQKANRDATVERFSELLREALTPRRQRKTTRTPARAKRQRLEEKKRRAEKKDLRKPPDW